MRAKDDIHNSTLVASFRKGVHHCRGGLSCTKAPKEHEDPLDATGFGAPAQRLADTVLEAARCEFHLIELRSLDVGGRFGTCEEMERIERNRCQDL